MVYIFANAVNVNIGYICIFLIIFKLHLTILVISLIACEKFQIYSSKPVWKLTMHTPGLKWTVVLNLLHGFRFGVISFTGNMEWVLSKCFTETLCQRSKGCITPPPPPWKLKVNKFLKNKLLHPSPPHPPPPFQFLIQQLGFFFLQKNRSFCLY